MVGQMFTLPIGYWHSENKYDEVTLTPITGFIEDRIQDRNVPQAYLVTQLLTGCVDSIGEITNINPDIIRQLNVCDRDFLLLKLREITFGKKIEFTLSCPNDDCGKKMSINFDTNDLTLEKLHFPEPFISIEIDKTNIKFRLPNGSDLENVTTIAVNEPVVAAAEILKRCIKSIDGKEPTENDIYNLPKKAKDTIQKKMEQCDPLINLEMRAVCPECSYVFLTPFDIQDYFIKELNANPDIFYREIHYLAYYYRWTQSEILSLPRWKRKKYIEFLIDELSS